MTRRIRKLTDDQVRAIRASAGDAKILAARYGVQRSYVYRLRNGTRKQLVPDLKPGPADPGPAAALVVGSMKPVTIIAILRKDMRRVEQQLTAGEISVEFAERELSWMRQVVEHSQQAIVHAARHPPPSATNF
jgi:uncharacterized protein YgbK (DUF1537 family)